MNPYVYVIWVDDEGAVFTVADAQGKPVAITQAEAHEDGYPAVDSPAGHAKMVPFERYVASERTLNSVFGIFL